MSKLNVLILEDEGITAECIAGYVRDLGHSIGGIADSGEQALRLIKNRDIDLAILDIGINGKSEGIEVANKIAEIAPMPFIYITGTPEDEVEKINQALKTRPGAYVHKPVTKYNLKTALEIAQNNFVPPRQGVDGTVEHLFTEVKGKKIRIQPEDILYANAQQSLTYIYTSAKKDTPPKYKPAKKLKDCLDQLPRKTFCRVHRSYAVNLYKIDAIDKNKKHIFIGDIKIPIGGTYKDDFFGRIGGL